MTTPLQHQQARLNEILEKATQKVCVLFEGRDSAGKSFSIRELTHYLPTRFFRIEPSKMPSKRTMKRWLPHWKSRLPREEKIVLFDRSWYSRALLQPINGWCTQKQYRNFMRDVIKWEYSHDMLFIKFWLSISQVEQTNRLTNRKISPLKYWKFGANDKKALTSYDLMTLQKEAMFNMPEGKWNSIDYNSKSMGILKLITRLNDILEKTL